MKLNDSKTSDKTCWSILKSFYNNSKIPLIPPLLVNNKIVSDFTEKENLFNDFSATQCTHLPNNSVLPSSISLKTQTRLSSINFEKEDILKITRNFNVNKAQDHDNISIRMLKICDSVLVEPLSVIYKNCINSRVSPDIWIIPIQISYHSNIQKKDKRCISNYLPSCFFITNLWQNIWTYSL